MEKEAVGKKKVSKKQQAHVRKFMKSHYDRIEILVPKGRRAEIAAAAAAKGIPTGEYIKEAIWKKMAEDAGNTDQELPS